MKTNTILTFAAASLFAVSAFAQTPPTPPVPPVPPPNHGEREDKRPKVPVTFLGVETSSVPGVVADQLGLAKGFGLVVDYVVPDGPAAAAGLQQNDILKMLNDQILTEPDQLAKLVRSYSEGTSVTLTVLRKGTETKLTVKLGKREVPQGRDMWPGRGPRGERFGLGADFQEQMQNFREQMQDYKEQMKEQMKGMQFGVLDETVRKARDEARRARDEASRVAEEALRAARNGIHLMVNQDNGVLKTTRIDMGKAQITYSDPQGEMILETVDGKKVLTAKDAQGRLLFSGPVETKEELDKLPPEVRQRFEKLEQKDLPGIAPDMKHDKASPVDKDEDDNEVDEDDGGATVLQVRDFTPCGSYRWWSNHLVVT